MVEEAVKRTSMVMDAGVVKCDDTLVAFATLTPAPKPLPSEIGLGSSLTRSRSSTITGADRQHNNWALYGFDQSFPLLPAPGIDPGVKRELSELSEPFHASHGVTSRLLNLILNLATEP